MKNKWSIISLICGTLNIILLLGFSNPLVSFFSIILYLPFLVLAIIFGILSLKRRENKSLSIIGISLGILETLFLLICVWFWWSEVYGGG